MYKSKKSKMPKTNKKNAMEMLKRGMAGKKK